MKTGASGKGGSTYSAAYIHHLRDLSESNFYVDPGTQTKYSAFLVSEIFLEALHRSQAHISK